MNKFEKALIALEYATPLSGELKTMRRTLVGKFTIRKDDVESMKEALRAASTAVDNPTCEHIYESYHLSTDPLHSPSGARCKKCGHDGTRGSEMLIEKPIATALFFAAALVFFSLCGGAFIWYLGEFTAWVMDAGWRV